MVNAAPFSFFNVFCEDPPLCMFAVNKRPDGRIKDTLVNIQRTGEFVVNIPDEPLARAMHETSGDFPPEIGEPNYLGLKLAPSSRVAPPRLADTPWAMECKTWKEIDVNGDRVLVMGEGINFYIRDELWDRAGHARAHGPLSPDGPHVRRPLLPHRRPRDLPGRGGGGGGEDVAENQFSSFRGARSARARNP